MELVHLEMECVVLCSPKVENWIFQVCVCVMFVLSSSTHGSVFTEPSQSVSLSKITTHQMFDCCFSKNERTQNTCRQAAPPSG